MHRWSGRSDDLSREPTVEEAMGGGEDGRLVPLAVNVMVREVDVSAAVERFNGYQWRPPPPLRRRECPWPGPDRGDPQRDGLSAENRLAWLQTPSVPRA
jgi:hypothetical protein